MSAIFWDMDPDSLVAPRPTTPARRTRGNFLVIAAWLLAALALIGFWKTYFLPVLRGKFAGNWIFHVHGLLLFSWVALFVVQVLLVRRDRVTVHRQLGEVAIGLVPAVILSTLAVAVAAMRRDLAAGLGSTAQSTVVGVVTAMIWFGALVTWALLVRRRPDEHKRLMFVASVAVIWPAAFRLRHYFPSVARPDIIFALVLPSLFLVAAALCDWLSEHRVHRVYWIAGGGLVAEQSLEVLLFDGPAWQAVAQWLTLPFL